jgi:hypothetical protein
MKGSTCMRKISLCFSPWLGLMAAAMLSACAPSQPPQPPQVVPMPVSPWGGKYHYTYEPPEERAPGSVAITIIVVNPFYGETGSIFLDSDYTAVGKGFSASMGVDMDKIIIAKGMTVKGPVSSLNEITYPDKEGSDLTLAPSLFITTQVKYAGEWAVVNAQTPQARMERQFLMKIGGWISFVMQEPLSGEKMWIKKLDLDEISVAGFECAEAVPQYTVTKGFFGSTGKTITGYNTGQITYDGKIDAVANALKALYPVILSKFWTYIDANELLVLKEKVKEIRAVKVY